MASQWLARFGGLFRARADGTGRRVRWPVVAVGVLGGAAVLTLLLLAAMPVGWLRGRLEATIAAQTGTRATVGAVTRRELFSFSPTIVVRDLAIAQPGWAGDGDMIRLAEAEVRVPVWRALTGGVDPDGIRVRGLRADLVRDAQGRRNWDMGDDGDDEGDAPLSLSDLIVEDAVVRYRDAVRPMTMTLRVASDGAGLRAYGGGTIRRRPVRMVLAGAPLARSGAWPFVVRITGDALSAELTGRMAGALDFGRFSGKLTANADSLETIDAIVAAGLPGTQPIALTARLTRARPDWRLDDLSATIGRSRMTGELLIARRDGRTKLTGDIRASALDFDDLADDAALARGRAKRAATGPRVVPDTDIDIRDIGDLDAQVDLRVDRLLWRSSAPFRTLATTVTLDDRILTLEDVRVGLTRGQMTGSAKVDARGGKLPVLTLDLAVDRSSLGTFAGDMDVSAGLRGKARLVGRGATVRQAIGRSDGHVAIIVGEGLMPARMASFIGLDIGRGITTDADRTARLRCIVMRLDVAGGTGRLAPLVVDTTRSRADVAGTLTFPQERLDWRLTGAPKANSLLRYDRPFPVRGTIKDPTVIPPPGARSVGSVLGMLGKAITGDQAPLASDADCGALAARAMR